MNNIFTPQLKAEFDQTGFVCLPKFVSEADFLELDERTTDFISNQVPYLPRESVFYDDLENISSLKQIQKLYEFDDYFCQMMFASKFERLASFLLAADVKGVNMQYFNKPSESSKPTPAHQDGFYFMLEPNEAVTMWLTLDPTDEENGGVRYLPGSHLEGLRKHTMTETLGFSQGIEDYSDSDFGSEVCLDLQPGDLLVHHALTVHRADRNKSHTRSRRAIGLIYYSMDAVESPDKQSRQDSLIEQWTKQGKI